VMMPFEKMSRVVQRSCLRSLVGGVAGLESEAPNFYIEGIPTLRCPSEERQAPADANRNQNCQRQQDTSANHHRYGALGRPMSGVWPFSPNFSLSPRPTDGGVV
jgi:hypothetical protein